MKNYNNFINENISQDEKSRKIFYKLLEISKKYSILRISKPIELKWDELFNKKFDAIKILHENIEHFDLFAIIKNNDMFDDTSCNIISFSDYGKDKISYYNGKCDSLEILINQLYKYFITDGDLDLYLEGNKMGLL